MTSRVRLATALATAALLGSLVLGATPALASPPVWWTSSYAVPKELPPGGSGQIVINIGDLGNGSMNGGPIKLIDKLPQGLTVTSTQGTIGSCSHEAVEGVETVTCEGTSALAPYQEREVQITVSVAAAVPASAENSVSISGGGAEPDSSSDNVSFGSAPPSFGVSKLEQTALNENGTPDAQAGSHPFEYVTTIQLNEQLNEVETAKGGELQVRAPAPVKDLHFDLPPGLIGNATVTPQCTFKQFTTYIKPPFVDECPPDTAVGAANVKLMQGKFGLFVPLFGPVPVFNLVPNIGEPARFGFQVDGVPIILDTSVRTGGDYGVVVSVNNINTQLELTGSQVTLWGAPSSPSHDQSRGYQCILGGFWKDLYPQVGPCPESAQGGPLAPPFLTLPTSCTGPLQSSVQADSWADPGEYQTGEYTWHDSQGPLGLDGCNRLPFEPSIGVTPDGGDASSPTGLAVTEHIPQEDTLTPTGLAESDSRETVVALPVGVQISPAGGDGLLACSTEQIGFMGPTIQGGLEFADEEQRCPEASKVGTVRFETPLLPNPLTGAAYLATQDANPFSSLLAIYIVARDPISGVLVKVAGEVTLNPDTGQLVATFRNTPQLPYENLELHFFGSARAPLTTPPLCGQYTTHASIAPWSGSPPAEPSATFQIASGPNGAPCSDRQPFQPSFEAGSTNLQAGAFTPFTLTMSREDASQSLSSIELHIPPGLSGTLTKVKLCPEAQANEGTCGPESLIGETTVSVGLGDDPFTVKGGKVYITEKYGGAPFGLSIVNPAKAGPFDLERTLKHSPACDCLVVRAKIEVDPVTAALTVTSNPPGSEYSIPTMIEGVPLQIKHINVAINHLEEFTFNPTNCNRMAVTGTLLSAEGSSDELSVPFQVSDCGALAFKPQFAVATQAKTSREDGASLTARLSYPNVGGHSVLASGQANIAKVKVELPKQLPSRLSTLQKACPSKVFDTNPAGCPAASRIGEATGTTPILPQELEGPAYFVSNGGARFPELIVVLQGYGLTIDLHGETFIDKAGITSSTFATVPDVPVGSFTLKLPEGPDSALAANGSLCASKLVMPTEFVSQDDTVLKRSIPITVEGCKAAIRVVRHKTKGRKATIVVNVPTGGRLTASDGGELTAATRRTSRAGNLALALLLSRSGRAFLARHPGRQFAAHVKLVFVTTQGTQLTSSLTLLLG